MHGDEVDLPRGPIHFVSLGTPGLCSKQTIFLPIHGSLSIGFSSGAKDTTRYNAILQTDIL